MLLHSANSARFEELLASLRTAAVGASDGEQLRHEGVALRWRPCVSLDALVLALASHYVNLIVFDLRSESPNELESEAASLFSMLETLDRTDDVEERFAFDRILVLIPAAASPAVDDIVLRLGGRGVRNVLRGNLREGADERFARLVLDAVNRILTSRKRGKRALCASGGGITGIFFELGALKCLDDCLGGAGVNDFDMYFGISAGAVVSGPVAVGYSIDEYMAAIAGVAGGRMSPLDLRLFRFGHVDAPSFSRRASLAARTTVAGVWSALSGRRSGLDDALLFDYADLIAAPFRADRFERMLRDALGAPGGTNDFRELSRPLYVGATDQDARAHVLFGDEAHSDVPISLAIQASLSINPAFSATRIGSRFYEDGAVTRTSNFVEAIRRGATMVVVIDPFVPYVARDPGFADRRGMLYNLDQDVRTISYTRYETTRNWVLRQHPEVSAYTFIPANRLRRLLSMNPMDHRPFLEIWRGAYLSTFNRLSAIEHRFAGDAVAHGFPFSLARAAEVAARLERTERPDLADFFPDRHVRLARRPLCRQ